MEAILVLPLAYPVPVILEASVPLPRQGGTKRQMLVFSICKSGSKSHATLFQMVGQILNSFLPNLYAGRWRYQKGKWDMYE